MKRYICAILVPCFLLQLLAGCYSYRDITLKDLKKYYGANDIRITIIKDRIVLNRQSTGVNRMRWETNDSSIIVKTSELVCDNSSSKQMEKNYEIKFRDIQSLELSKYDGLRTGLLVGAATIVGIIIIAGIAFATSDKKFSLGRF